MVRTSGTSSLPAMTSDAASRPMPTLNVGGIERLASAAGAAGLLAWAERGATPEAGVAARLGAGYLLFRALTGFCPLYAGARVNTRQTDSKRVLAGSRGAHVRETVVVRRPVGEVYAVWRHLENLPRFMSHLEEVRPLDGRVSHWVARGPGGVRVEWDAEIVNEVPDKLIGWRSLEGADVVSAGSVNFRELPGHRGTEVRVVLQYEPPGGKLAASVGQFFGADAATQIREDLDRFRSWLETGRPPMREWQASKGVTTKP